MAIRISGNTVITDSRVLQNVTGFKTVAGQAILGTGNIEVGGNLIMRAYTSPATWTKPANLKAVKVIVTGGGGGVANTGTSPVSQARPGGGGGGTSITYIDASQIPGPVSVTVGVGGNVTSTTGGTSSFGSFASATGGSPAGGGTATGGLVNVPGEDGQPSSTVVGQTAAAVGGNNPAPAYYARVSSVGKGGSSLLGFGGEGTAAGFTTSTSMLSIGVSASIPGKEYGGGSSGVIGATSPSTAGGTGGPGIVIVEEFY